MEHWAERRAFLKRREKAEQQERAFAQFGNGRVPPPTPPDPRPTRQPKPIENIVTEAVSRAA